MEPVHKVQFAGKKIEPFVQVVNILALAAGAQGQGSFTVDDDADFIWTDGYYMADIAAAAQTDATRVVPLVLLAMQNSTTNRALSQIATPLPLGALFGGREPMPLAKPLLVSSKSVMQIQATNYDAAAAYNLRLAFVGYKVFKAGR